MEQLLLLLIVGLIAGVRWLFVEGGLRKLLDGLEGDLNNKKDTMRQQIPPPIQANRPSARLETEEEIRLRKFMDALGMPTTSAPPTSQPTPGQRARIERERIQRKLAERARRQPPQLPQPTRPVPARQQPSEDESAGVGQYFQLEKFDQPGLAPEVLPVISVDLPLVTPILASVETPSPSQRLERLLQGQGSLRGLILAQEILGRPKSLQTV